MKLKLFVDRLSQPCRAILIFCKLNGIEFEEVTVDFCKRENLSPEYQKINPMQLVPAIEVDGEFKLCESHAILRFLACAFPGVADHWYPADLFERAKIDSVLDWHHSNLRYGTTGLLFNGSFYGGDTMITWKDGNSLSFVPTGKEMMRWRIPTWQEIQAAAVSRIKPIDNLLQRAYNRSLCLSYRNCS